jgi:hypothetical protein
MAIVSLKGLTRNCHVFVVRRAIKGGLRGFEMHCGNQNLASLEEKDRSEFPVNFKCFGRGHDVVWLVSVDSRTIPPTGSADEKKRKVYLCHTTRKT